MINLLGIGSSPRAREPHAMSDSLSERLQSVLEVVRESCADGAAELINPGDIRLQERLQIRRLNLERILIFFSRKVAANFLGKLQIHWSFSPKKVLAAHRRIHYRT